MESTVYAGPVRAWRDGRWQTVDLTLRRNADGSVAPAVHPFDLNVSGKRTAVTGELAAVGFGADRVSMGWSGALPEPELERNRATYVEVRPGIDLVIEATRAGVEQFVVVKNRKAVEQVESLAVPLTGPSVVSHTRDASGAVSLKDKSGRVVATSPAPLMWDAQLAPDGESPLRRAAVKATVAKQAPVAATRATTTAGEKVAAKSARPGGVKLTLTPDTRWLNDPATVFPVTIDPQLNPVAKTTFDTFVTELGDKGNDSAGDLQFGLLNSTPLTKTRSFVRWDTARLKRKQITEANVFFYNYWSQVCTPVSWEIWSTAEATSATKWSNQPAWLYKEGTSTQTKGGGKDCTSADGWVSADATSFFQRAAAGGQAVGHMGLRATSESHITGFKQFRSRNAPDNAQVPYATVKYNSYPVVGTRSTTPSTTCATGSGRPYIASKTPKLSASVTDAEASTLSATFEWSTTAGAGTTAATTSKAASGSTFSYTIPANALAENGSYRWRVRGYDATGYSPWSAYCEFTVDTTAPATKPSITSTDYPAGQWAGAAGTSGKFNLSAAGATDVAAFEYGLDTDPPTQRIDAAALGGAATVSLAPGSDGPHTLFVRSVDRAGNHSPMAHYTFQVGSGAVLRPEAGDLTAGMTSLEGVGKVNATGATYQWRRGDADAWAAIPAADVTLAEGGGAVSWPLPTTQGKVAKLNWNVAKTLNDAEDGPDPLDGPVQVRAVFSGGGADASSAVPFTLDRNRASAASTSAGPGEVNLLTGNLSVTDMDASGDSTGDLALTRTYNSRQSGGTDPMFGPGWVSGVGADEANAPYTGLTVTGSLVQVNLSEGGSIGFARKATSAAGATFDAELGAEDLTLTYGESGDTYALADTDGTTVTFTRPTGTPAGQYLPTGIESAGAAQETTVSWERAVVDGVTLMRPTRSLAAVPNGVSCANTLAKGCRALSYSYASTTTASGIAPQTWGDYQGRVRQVSFTAFDPASDKMATVVLARYAYDNTGRLRTAWDPRLDLDGGKHVASTYAYDGDGVLAEVRPAGQEPWVLSYTTMPGDPGKGRLHKVSRTAPGFGAAVSTIVYRVPVAGEGAPYDLSATQTNRWGQQEPPVDATAIFNPEQVPDGDPANGKLPGSYRLAGITYVDANGRQVNTVEPGGYTTATWLDQWGNAVREMSAANVRRALNAVDGDTPAQEAYAAETLSTISIYAADGLQLVETFGPAHDVTLPSTGTTVRGRKHTVTRYDENIPADHGPYHLPTTETVSVSYEQNGVRVDDDVRTMTTVYDWDLQLPTSQTVDPNGLKLTTRAGYDKDSGNVLTSTTPGGGASDNTPSTRRAVYYRDGTGSGYAECDGKPHWAGLVCRNQPNAQPGSGPELPVTVTTYDMFYQPATVIEKAGDKVLRRTTNTYDAAARIREVAVHTPGSTSEAVPVQRQVYDSATGNLTATQSIDATGKVLAEVTRGYDSLGRRNRYTDADGNVSATEFDVLGRVAVTRNGKSTRTVSYEAATGTRGPVETVVDTLAGGAFTAEYGADGGAVRETWPNGVVVTSDYNETGARTKVAYERPNCGRDSCGIFYDVAGSNVHGQKRWTASTTADRVYDYDAAGRLQHVQETLGGDCIVRKYKFDAADNRKAFQLFGAAEDGSCQSTTPTSSRSYTYDTADRIVGGYTYDDLGRTTVVPAADTGSPASGDASVTYHSTDLVDTITQGARRTDYTLDVTGGRVRSWTDTATGVVVQRRHHYADDSDSPAWTEEASNTFTAAVPSVTGMAGIKTSTGFAWEISNLHGDLVATILNDDSGVSSTHEADEYGNPSNPDDVGTRRYGWLGASQRPADNPSGIFLMGVRLYNPVTGRFLQIDPVYGGNTNPYVYPADPVNRYDTTGKAVIAIPLVAIPVGAVVLAAIVAVVVTYAFMCVIKGCTISIPSVRVKVPWPNPKSKSAKNHRKSHYIIYMIYYRGVDEHVVYKYGISRRGASRPQSQIESCAHYFRITVRGGRGCGWKRMRSVTGWYTARSWEAAYILNYVRLHWHCPPGQYKSCR